MDIFSTNEWLHQWIVGNGHCSDNCQMCIRDRDRFDMQDKKMDKVIKGRNCLDGEELLDNQDLCLLLNVAPDVYKRQT